MYLILGLARSGLSITRFLHEKAIDFCVWDDNEDSRKKAEQFGYTLYTDQSIESVIVSPGISLKHPILAKIQHAPILTDVYLFQHFTSPKARFIGITGTNGKSTTTALVTHILKKNGIKASMGGNIGIPVFDLSLDEEVYVLELSSFQLERSPPLTLDLACWINFSPDHLVEHGSLENYFNAKQKIFEKAHDRIVGIDDAFSKKMLDLQENNPIKKDGHIIPVRVSDQTLQAYEHPFLKGEHNRQNILMAYHIAICLGLCEDAILKGMETFLGLRHRQQHLATHEGITFINDSKATSAAAVGKALGAYSNIYWILGGQAKSDGLDLLSPLLSSKHHPVRHAFTFGESAEDFARFLKERSIPVASFHTLKEAFYKAVVCAQKEARQKNSTQETTLLFSPACASFDQYKDFEARGEHFIDLVNLYIHGNS